GAKWGDDVLAYVSPDRTVCECCHPAIAATDDGGAVLAFRNAVDGERDVWTARLAKGAVAFGRAKKCGEGKWKLEVCPMAGPEVAARGADFACIFRREKRVVLVYDGKEHDFGEGTDPVLYVAKDGVHPLWLLGDTLVQRRPGA